MRHGDLGVAAAFVIHFGLRKNVDGTAKVDLTSHW